MRLQGRGGTCNGIGIGRNVRYAALPGSQAIRRCPTTIAAACRHSHAIVLLHRAIVTQKVVLNICQLAAHIIKVLVGIAEVGGDACGMEEEGGVVARTDHLACLLPTCRRVRTF